jgi:dephospho-CoA kinase
MIKVGLTGNIGSGKSTICKIFETLGIAVFYSDDEAKKLYFKDNVKETIRNKFGDRVFDTDGNVAFKKLADVIFNDKRLLEFINKLIHPLVNEEYKLWLEKYRFLPFTIYETAILFERNLASKFDKTIVVTCPVEKRIDRVVQRDGISRSSVEQRIKHQMSDEHKIKLADFVIVNDGEHYVIPQVMNIYHQLIQSHMNL